MESATGIAAPPELDALSSRGRASSSQAHNRGRPPGSEGAAAPPKRAANYLGGPFAFGNLTKEGDAALDACCSEVTTLLERAPAGASAEEERDGSA